MSDSESASGGVAATIDRTAARPEREPEGVDREAMLSLMSDEYARDILNVLGEEPLAARELVDRLDASRATVYRRLDKLESAGVVESSMSIHPEGHHRKQFRVAVDRVRLTVGADGVTIKIPA
jgi:predicted transcriptional regulator